MFNEVFWRVRRRPLLNIQCGAMPPGVADESEWDYGWGGRGWGRRAKPGSPWGTRCRDGLHKPCQRSQGPDSPSPPPAPLDPQTGSTTEPPAPKLAGENAPPAPPPARIPRTAGGPWAFTRLPGTGVATCRLICDAYPVHYTHFVPEPRRFGVHPRPPARGGGEGPRVTGRWPGPVCGCGRARRRPHYPMRDDLPGAWTRINRQLIMSGSPSRRAWSRAQTTRPSSTPTPSSAAEAPPSYLKGTFK